jgi:replication factor A1
VIKDIESHIDDILNALGEKSEKEVTRDELKRELNKFMEYGVPIDQAKQTLIKKFGGIAVLSSSGQSSERTLISDLQPNERSVNLLCRVIAVNPKEITVKGDTRKIFYGILGDESGTIPFTAWKSELDIEKGDVIEISNAYTREWQGAAQLNFGDRISIKKTDKDKLPESAFTPRELKVNDFRSGIGAIDVTVRILEVNEREAEVGGETKKVFSGTLADETGKAQFTSWYDFKLKKDEVFRITGGYIKSWKGIPQLTFDQRATVKKLDKSKIPKGDIKLTKTPIHTLIEKRGAVDVNVEGAIIEVRPGSGVITRCPECNRTIQNGVCSIHGKVNGIQDLRLKLIVDDGTGSISTVLNKDLTEKILGKSFEECKKIDENSLLNEINKKLFAHKINLRGNALGDEFGTSLIARDAKPVDIDIKEEALKLSKELEELL